MNEQRVPGVLFVCVKNSGKSQMAGALLRSVSGAAVRVFTAGTQPGNALNSESVTALHEIGVSVGDEKPKPISEGVLAEVDLVILLGREAAFSSPELPVRRWVTDEPSTRGIDGIERMRLIQADILARVEELYRELVTP